MQDTRVVFIIPNTVICKTIRRVLKRCGHNYPVFALSTVAALEKARELVRNGARIIVSHGLTHEYIRKRLDVPMLDLPFSSLEAALGLKAILRRSQRIAYMGTMPFLRHFNNCLNLLDLDRNIVKFFQLREDQPLEEQAREVINAGYEVIIGGFPTVNYARQCGKIGVEFDVDEQVAEITINGATGFVKNLIEEESKRELIDAILNSASDGIIAVDGERRIQLANLAAREILNLPVNAAPGMPLEEVMKRGNILDVLTPGNAPPPCDAITVILKEVQVSVGGQMYGNVISIAKTDEIHDLDYKIRKRTLYNGLVAKKRFSDISGSSEAITQAKERARTYAHYDSTILITGETGTGKELFAQSIHNESSRRKQPFVAINCAALPENLIESELFGYVKGAFTGASNEGKLGLFEATGSGTIFLDEIGEIPLSMQAKLLRVLQEREIIRIGSDRVVRVDARILCSTNKNLLQMVAEGRFKEDLYYRLCILEVNVPPLRERKEDIPLIVRALIRRFNAMHRKSIADIHPTILAELQKLSFPGNVRELGNILERMAIMAEGSVIDEATYAKSGFKITPAPPFSPEKEMLRAPGMLKDAQHRMILRTLEQTGGNKSAAARLLGINPTTLWRKLKNSRASETGKQSSKI